MLISTPSSNQLLLQFPTETERKEFEQWIRLSMTVLATTPVEHSTTEEKNHPILAHSQPSDQKLARIEKARTEAQTAALIALEKAKKNRDGLLPWRSLPPNGSPRETF
jgi:hypothetical protein